MNTRVNDNFHHLGGDDVLQRADARFREYRRQWQENPDTFTVAPYPLFLDIEVTSACNLRCPFCATTYRGAKISRGFMTGELYRRVIDEGAAHGLYGAKFNIRGEPLLHPELPAFVAYAKQRGLLDVYFNTNAQLLDYDRALQLIDAGLDRISISIEGTTAAVYEHYRPGGTFTRLRANLEGLLAARRARQVPHPRIRIQSVMIPELAGELDAYAAFWQPYADEIAYLDYKEMKERRRGMVCQWACPQLWQRMAIWWDGTVVPCNHDDDARLALGNAGTHTLHELWHGETLQRVRQQHRDGLAHTVPACDGCYLRDSEISKDGNRCQNL